MPVFYGQRRASRQVFFVKNPDFHHGLLGQNPRMANPGFRVQQRGKKRWRRKSVCEIKRETTHEAI